MLNLVQTSKSVFYLSDSGWLDFNWSIRFSNVDRSQKPFDLRDEAFFSRRILGLSVLCSAWLHFSKSRGHHVEEDDQSVRFGCHGDPATQRRKIDIPEARFRKIRSALGCQMGPLESQNWMSNQVASVVGLFDIWLISRCGSSGCTRIRMRSHTKRRSDGFFFFLSQLL